MGQRHDKPNARRRRPRPRICLRKGCGQKYQPRRWNQRYCQDPECLRLLRRWQAAKRQAKRRQDEAVKVQHAQAERVRRQRAISLPQPPKPAKLRQRVVTQQKFFAPVLCDRPGCHEPPPKWGRNQASYCCPPAVRRCAGYWIVNASGSGVAPFEVSSAPAGVPDRPGATLHQQHDSASDTTATAAVSRSASLPAAPVGSRWPCPDSGVAWDEVCAVDPRCPTESQA